MLAPIVAQKRSNVPFWKSQQKGFNFIQYTKLPKKLLTTGKGHIFQFSLYPFFKSQQRCRMPHILFVPVIFLLLFFIQDAPFEPTFGTLI